MTWSSNRARIEQKTKALQLLTLSGAIRGADVERHYRGSEISLGVTARPEPEFSDREESIWSMDLLKAFQARKLAARSRSTMLSSGTSSRRMTPERPPAPRAA